MTDPNPIPAVPANPNRRKAIALGLIALGCVIATVGGSLILRLKAPVASSYLVSPDLPLALGDTLRLRRGATECATIVREVLSGGDLRVVDCVGAEVVVSRAALSVESYRPGESTPAVGDVVITRLGGTDVRAEVVALEPDHRLRLLPIGEGSVPVVVFERVAFRVRPAGAR